MTQTVLDLINAGVKMVMDIGRAIVKSEKLQDSILRDVLFGVAGIAPAARGEHLSSYVALVKERGVANLPERARKEYTGMTLKERQAAMVDRSFRSAEALYLAKGINVLEKTASVCRNVLKALEANGTAMQPHVEAFLDERITGSRLIAEAKSIIANPTGKPEAAESAEAESAEPEATEVDPATYYLQTLTTLKAHADKTGTQDVLLAALAQAFGPVVQK